MQTHHGIADVNGTHLYYEVSGLGEPLVLIHGFTLDTRTWDDQLDPFARHYQVIRYDMRGFGQSALPAADPYTHADDLKALLEHLGIARASILGLSMGGEVAINFALAYPRATRALIAADTALTGFRWSKEFIASLDSVLSSGVESHRGW